MLVSHSLLPFHPRQQAGVGSCCLSPSLWDLRLANVPPVPIFVFPTRRGSFHPALCGVLWPLRAHRVCPGCVPCCRWARTRSCPGDGTREADPVVNLRLRAVWFWLTRLVLVL